MIEQGGLVGVEQTAAFAFGLVALALQDGELGADQLAVVWWGGGDDCLLAGEQLRGVEQRVAGLDA